MQSTIYYMVELNCVDDRRLVLPKLRSEALC